MDNLKNTSITTQPIFTYMILDLETNYVAYFNDERTMPEITEMVLEIDRSSALYIKNPDNDNKGIWMYAGITNSTDGITPDYIDC